MKPHTGCSYGKAHTHSFDPLTNHQNMGKHLSFGKGEHPASTWCCQQDAAPRRSGYGPRPCGSASSSRRVSPSQSRDGTSLCPANIKSPPEKISERFGNDKDIAASLEMDTGAQYILTRRRLHFFPAWCQRSQDIAASKPQNTSDLSPRLR